MSARRVSRRKRAAAGPRKDGTVEAGSAGRGGAVASAAAAVFLLALLAYVPVLRCDFVNWDDYRFVIENKALADPAGLASIWSTLEMPRHFPNYPLVFTSFWAEHKMWGLDAAGYHATNALFHAANSVLVLLILGEMAGFVWPVFVASALFAVHPMQVESVAWVTERKNVLSGFFYLLAFLLYLRHRERRKEKWYVLSLAAYAAALLSKTATVVLPLSLLLHDRLRDGRWRRDKLLRIVPMLLLATLASLLTASVEHKASAASLSPAARPLLAAAALWFYAIKLVVPVQLLPLYPQWQVAAGNLFWWLPALGVIGAAAALWRRPPSWQAQWGLGHFACTLLPVLGFVPFGFTRYTYVADRYVYLACLGLFFAAALSLDRWRRRTAAVAVLAYVAVLGSTVLTWRQVRYWQNSTALWTHALAGNPQAWPAHNNLGKVLLDAGDVKKAAAHFRAALAVNPEFTKARVNLAMAMYRLGEFRQSERQSRRALQMAPGFADAHSNLALALQAQGRLVEAEREYRRAIRLFPNKAELYFNYATALAAQRRHEEAVAEFERALKLDPELTDVRNNLAASLVALGRVAEAAEQLRGSLRVAPNDAEVRYNLASVLVRLGRRGEAVEQLRVVLRLRPDFERARAALGKIRAGGGA